jgi:hypothetical protein
MCCGSELPKNESLKKIKNAIATINEGVQNLIQYNKLQKSICQDHIIFYGVVVLIN